MTVTRSDIQVSDLFAVDLTSNGVTLEIVATLVGNIIKISEYHYLQWVKTRQIYLEKSVEKAWKLLT